MNKDSYGEIVNGVETYREIAEKLVRGKSVIIGWTDEEYTHYDILFTPGAYKEENNYLQRGLKTNDLFVSIMSKTAFGFKVEKGKKSVDYIAEKMSLNGAKTIEKFGDLINGVIKEIIKEIGVK